MTAKDVTFRLTVSGAAKAEADAEGVADAISRIGEAGNAAAPGARKIVDAVNGLGGAVPGLANSTGKMRDAIGGVGAAAQVSAAQTAAAMRMLPAQMTDVATQIAGGANPFLVLLQQGGQVKDSFGGFGPMFRGIASAISPVKLAVAGLAATVGGVIAAFYGGQQESRRLADALALSGNMAAKSAGQIDGMVSSLAAASSAAKGDVRDLLTALAASGQQAVETFDSSARAALALARLNGKAAADNIAAFDGMAESASAWALKANKAYHFLTAATFEEIRALEEQGRNQEAARIGLDALAGTLEQRTAPALGAIERALQSLSKGWSAMWDAAKGIGREDTAEAAIAKQADLVRQLRGVVEGKVLATMGQSFDPRSFAQQLKQAEAELQQMTRLKASDDLRRSNRAADQRVEEDTIARRQALAALNDRLTGTNSAYGKSLRVLHESYQAGELTLDAYRTKVAKLIEIEGGGKDMADKARAAMEASLALRVQTMRNAADAELRVQDDLQAALAHSRALGLVDEKVYATQSAAIASERLAAQMRALGQQIAAERAKPTPANDAAASTQKQVALKALEGQMAALQAQADRVPVELRWKLDEMDAAQARKALAGRLDILAAQADEAARETASVSAAMSAKWQEAEAAGLDEQATRKLTLARIDASMAAARAQLIEKESQGATAGVIAAIEERIAALGSLKSAQESVYAGIDMGRVRDALSPDVVRSFGDEFENAFGRAGGAVATLMTALDQYGVQQRELAKLQAAAQGNPAAQAKLAAQAAQAQVSSYATMAGAAKSFFREGSKGYKALEGAEKAFRAVELALAIKTTAEKLGLISSVTAAKLAGDQAQSDSLIVSAAKQIAAFFGIGQAAAVTGVANQAAGDPYTAWIRMAAMAATMAALGFSVRSTGGGGGMTAAQRQEQNGTGTVLGDATAKSQSISKSIERMRDAAEIGLTYQSGMLAALQNIEASMAGVSAQVLRSGGINTGKNLGIATGTLAKNTGDPLLGLLGFNDSFATKNMPLLGGIIGTLQGLWGKTKQEITDAGLNIAGTVADLARGSGVQQYADVQTTKSSWFGLKKDTSNSTVYGAVDDSIAKQFGLIFDNIADTLQASAAVLGKDGQAISDAVSGFVVDIGKLSLKDLKGDELQEAIATAIGAEADKIAASVLPGLEAFQQVGEGYYETLLRVGAGVETAQYQLDLLNVSMVEYADLARKQGDVGAELVRQSIEAAESGGGALSNVGRIIDTLDGTAAELASAYKQLVDVRYQLQATGLDGSSLSEAMIRGGGGLSNLSSALDSYLSEFFSEEERTAAGLAKLTDQFRALAGQDLPSTRDAFRAYVQNIDRSTEAGQQLYAQVLSLAGSFAELVPAAGAAARSLADIAAERYNLETTLLQLQGKTDELRARELAQLDPSNRALQEEIWRLQDAQASAAKGWSSVGEAASASASSAANAWDSVWSSMADEVKRLRGASATSAAASMASLQAQFVTATAQARAGSADAGKTLPELSKQIDDAALKTSRTRVDYQIVQAKLAASLERTLTTTGAPAEILQGLRGDVQSLRDDVVGALAQVASYTRQTTAVLKQFNADGMPETRT